VVSTDDLEAFAEVMGEDDDTLLLFGTSWSIALGEPEVAETWLQRFEQTIPARPYGQPRRHVLSGDGGGMYACCIQKLSPSVHFAACC
jgi:hypothetical protein